MMCCAPGLRERSPSCPISGSTGCFRFVPHRGRAGIIGEDIIAAEIERTGLAHTIANFRSGALEFHHQRRFDDSLAELARREESADVRVAPLIRDRDEVLMLTHSHPHPVLVNEIARQIADRLDLSFALIERDEYLRYSTITLPEFGKVLSPYTVSDLGLNLPYDLHWLKIGRDLIIDI